MSKLIQFYTITCANLLSLGYGNVLAWSSPILPILESDETPLACGKLSLNHLTWISSAVCIGNIFGGILSAIMVEKTGRKITVYATAIPLLISWLMLIFATTFIELLIARILGGIVGGATYLVIPMYVTEIAEDSIRGTLGALLQFSANFGILSGYVWGGYLGYYYMSYLCIIFPLLFIIGFSFVPDTPAYLLSQNQTYKAEKSLKFFRGYKADSNEFSLKFQNELESFKLKAKSQALVESKLQFKDFTTKSSKRAILIGFVLFTTLQGCGGFVLLNYNSMIFYEAGTAIHPNTVSIIVSVILILGTCVATVLVDRAGRRPLMIWSSITSGMSLTVMGIYFYLKNLGYHVTDYSWISIIGMAGLYFNSSWGIVGLPFGIVAELLPFKLRAIMSMYLRIYLAVLAFILVKYFFDMMEVLGIHWCMFLFAIDCFLTALFLYFYLPETKGKSIDEIIEILSK